MDYTCECLLFLFFSSNNFLIYPYPRCAILLFYTLGLRHIILFLWNDKCVICFHFISLPIYVIEICTWTGRSFIQDAINSNANFHPFSSKICWSFFTFSSLFYTSTAERRKSLTQFETAKFGSSLIICPLMSRTHPLRACLVHLLRIYFGGVTITLKWFSIQRAWEQRIPMNWKRLQLQSTLWSSWLRVTLCFLIAPNHIHIVASCEWSLWWQDYKIFHIPHELEKKLQVCPYLLHFSITWYSYLMMASSDSSHN